ncbi:MAG: DUF1622 domain-containing protein [Amaricoccus sp.]
MEEILKSLSSSRGLMHGDFARLVSGLEWVSSAIDLASIAIMLVGSLRFITGFVGAEFAADATDRLRRIDRHRMELGRYILSALELLIVSDIIHTALSLELADLLFLAALVLIRSLISYFLNREISEIRGEMER